MMEIRNEFKMLIGIPEVIRPRERLRRRYNYILKSVLNTYCVRRCGLTHPAHDRDVAGSNEHRISLLVP
jgi:hypothetical protein